MCALPHVILDRHGPRDETPPLYYLDDMKIRV